jgi:hypothetical protein
MTFTLVNLLEKKDISTFQEYDQELQNRIIKNSIFTKKIK